MQEERGRLTRSFKAGMRVFWRDRPFAMIAMAALLVLLVGCCIYAGVSLSRRVEVVPTDRSALEPIDIADEASREAEPESQDTSIFIDVSGAVRDSRVVELHAGARVQDAIDAAGGLADDACTDSLNRAQVLTDGQKVYVPHIGEDASGRTSEMGEGAVKTPSSRVNINTASVDQLDALPGVGPSTAQAIIDDRDANGPFTSIDDIMRVSGIGEKKFEKLKASICV